MKKVVFLGLGYIGLPTAAVAAAHGFEVIGVDVNPSVVETINQGKRLITLIFQVSDKERNG